MICLTIAIRGQKDPVVDYISAALSATVDELNIDGVASLQVLKDVDEMLGETKFDKMKMKHDANCQLTDSIWYVRVFLLHSLNTLKSRLKSSILHGKVLILFCSKVSP